MSAPLPRAPDFLTLFRFEEAIERAVVYALTAAGLAAYRSRDRASRKTPCVEVRLLHGKAGTHRSQFAPGKFMQSTWSGQLVLSVVTNRADPAQAAPEQSSLAPSQTPVDHGADTHAEMLGKVRVVMLYASAQLVEANPRLLYHYIERIEDGGVVPRMDQEEDLDISPMVFNLIYGIRQTAWPLPPV